MVTYRSSGVNIDAGNLLVKKIKKHLKGIGGFAGLFPISVGGKKAYLVGSVDGVGTKLKLAFRFNMHDGVGIDLVAMNVNDLICCGAKPLFFLDYYGTGKLNVNQAEKVIKGIMKGCAQGECALLGGETAEMPGFYKPGEYDLAGFAVGMLDKKEIIDNKSIKPGNLVVGLPSSGPHSNGYSLIRKVLKGALLSKHRKALLKPTRIYVKDINKLKKSGVKIKGLCHITGGGFYDNIPRILPKGCSVRVYSRNWKVPEVFKLIQREGGISSKEMYRVLNMGIGMVAVIDYSSFKKFAKVLPGARLIGEVIKGDRKVIIEGI